MEFLETKYLYFILLAFSFAYPLAQSFEWRLTYYKKWRHLFLGILVMMLIFIPWDIWFTKISVWWFRSDYISGIKLFNLPLEECLFFVIVPFACVFIYEVLNYFIKKDILKKIYTPFLLVLAIILFIVGVFNIEKLYTSITFLSTATALITVLIINPKWLSRFTLAYLVSLVPFLLINGILTGSFIKNPIVNYNPDHILNIRIFTIPVEDSIYNMLMLLIVIATYEFSKTFALRNS